MKKKAAAKRLEAVELWLAILNVVRRNCSLLSKVRTLFEKAAGKRLRLLSDEVATEMGVTCVRNEVTYILVPYRGSTVIEDCEVNFFCQII